MLVAIRENVAKLKQQERSLDETIASKPTRHSTRSGVSSLSLPPCSREWSMKAYDAAGVSSSCVRVASCEELTSCEELKSTGFRKEL
jgi:hypothetical protein